MISLAHALYLSLHYRWFLWLLDQFEAWLYHLILFQPRHFIKKMVSDSSIWLSENILYRGEGFISKNFL